MKIWIETRLVEQPDFVVSGRYGSSVCFVYYDRLIKRWDWVQPKGVVERIAEPHMIFVEQSYVDKHTLAQPRARTEKPTRIRRKRSAQLVFDW